MTRDISGDCIWWCSKKLLGRPCPSTDEAGAILHTLVVAQMNGSPNIMIESDCLQIINILSNESPFSAPSGVNLEVLSFFLCFLFWIVISFCKVFWQCSSQRTRQSPLTLYSHVRKVQLFLWNFIYWVNKNSIWLK